MSYAPGAPPCIWALRIDPGTKLTLLCSWSRADHQDQQNPKPCTIWFPRRFYAADHPKAGKAMPPASARDLDVAERTGSTPSAVRKHFTKLRALGLADASGRCVELTPASQDCPHRGTDCDDTTNPSVASTATTGAETATLGAKTATTGSAHLTPPVPPTPPTPAVEARDLDVDQYGIAAPTAEERDMVYGDIDAQAEQLPPPPRAQARSRPPGLTWDDAPPRNPPDMTWPDPVDPWAAKVRAASEAAHYYLDQTADSTHSGSYAVLLRQARANYGDARVLEALRIHEADAPEHSDGRPPAGKVWHSSWSGWVERVLGIEAPAAKPRAGHFPMRGALGLVS